MRTGLRLAALVLMLAVVAFWFFGGANLGWTKTSVPHVEKDPVTEIEVNVYEKRFVPGVDFLGAGFVVVALITGSSFFFGNRKESPPVKS